MRTILVDDEPLAMKRFAKMAEKLEGVEIVGMFDIASEAVDFIRHSEAELAVLDIEMPGMNGIELTEELRRWNPDLVVIFITGYEDYALKAFHLHAAAYLLKPFNFEELRYAVRTAGLLMGRRQGRVFIRTFGSFDVFIDGRPIFFKSAKAKELLALLVDAKGSTVSSGYAISMLWEDRPFDEKSQSLYYKVARSLEETLNENHIGQIVIRTRYERCLNRREVECDYYQFLKGDRPAREAFTGEYMSQYPWGEETLAALLNMA